MAVHERKSWRTRWVYVRFARLAIFDKVYVTLRTSITCRMPDSGPAATSRMMS
jgi:hypothetical protein